MGIGYIKDDGHHRNGGSQMAEVGVRHYGLCSHNCLWEYSFTGIGRTDSWVGCCLPASCVVRVPSQQRAGFGQTKVTNVEKTSWKLHDHFFYSQITLRFGLTRKGFVFKIGVWCLNLMWNVPQQKIGRKNRIHLRPMTFCKRALSTKSRKNAKKKNHAVMLN